MAVATLTTFDGLLKERYIDSNKVEQLTYPDNTLLGMLEKRGDTGMVGDTLPVPILSALPQGVGGVFSTAQTAATASTTNKWNITPGSYYGITQIDDKLIKASRSNNGAFLTSKEVEIDGLYEQMAEMLSIHLWGNGGGTIGRRSSAATNDITLTEVSDSQNFEVGMSVVASSADGSDAADALRAGTIPTVTAVNRATGVITLSSAAAITGFADNDYLFRAGDFAGDTLIVTLKGIQAFVSGTDAPPALWGVTAATRATDPQRFAGCRVAATEISGKAYDERILTLLAWMGSVFKAKGSTAGFLNPLDFQVLVTLMMAKGERPLKDDTTNFGYTKINITGPGGTVPIYTDRHCPKGTFFAFRMENLWISSIDDLIHVQNEDGLQMLRRSTSTDYEFRIMSYPLLACSAPKNQGRCSLTV